MTRPVVFGEVLFDQFPNGEAVLGGAPFNVAWHLQGFGFSPLLVTRVGEDEPGSRVRAAMAHWGMDLSGVQTDAVRPTGKVLIELGEGEHRFDILPEQAYDHIEWIDLPEEMQSEPTLLYHGSLIARTGEVRRVLRKLVEQTRAPVFVDVNLRAPWWHETEVREMLMWARWVKVNEEELHRLANGANRGDSLTERAKRFRAAYELELLLVTLGADGALAIDAADEISTVKPHRGVAITDTVGAGDAFCSVVVVGLLQGWPLASLLERAQSFASRVCAMRGATSADAALYREAKRQWNMGV